MKSFSAPTNFSNAAQFYPDDTGQIGTFNKSPTAQTLVTLDYGAGVPTGTWPGIIKFAFTLDVQTTPLLTISSAEHHPVGVMTFIVGGGLGGITYDLTVQLNLANNTVRTDTLRIDVVGDSMKHDPCCTPMGKPIVSPFTKALNQAKLSGDCSKYVSSCISYFICDTAPVNANVLDQWYDTKNHVVYEYLTDGTTFWWQPLWAIGSENCTYLYYLAVASQTVFNTLVLDTQGNAGVIHANDSVQATVNGARLVPTLDYKVNTSQGASTVTFLRPIPQYSTVSIDICTPFVPERGGGNTNLVVSDIAPSDPGMGDLWFDSVGGQLYIWYNDGNSSQWVPVTNVSGGSGGGGGGSSAIAVVGDTPPASVSNGQLWFDTNAGQMYIWYRDVNSSQWVPVVNQTIAGPQGTQGLQGPVGPQGPQGPAGAAPVVSDTPPAPLANGTQWFNSADGQMYVWYEDASSSQWVPATNVK